MSRPLSRRLGLIFLLLSLSLQSRILVTAAVPPGKRSSNRTPKCLYKTLGINSATSASEKANVTPDQLKKAYRKECLKHHPDKGGDEEQFKEIQRAYDVLSDPEKKQLYDQYGHAGINNEYTPFGGGGGGPTGAGAASGGGVPPFFFSQNNGGRQGSFQSFSFGTNGASSGMNLNVEELLRDMMMGGGGGRRRGFGGPPPQGFSSPFDNTRDADDGYNRRPQRTYERNVYCSLEDLYKGTTKKLKVKFGKSKSRVYSLDIRAGWKDGTRIKYPAVKQSSSASFPAMTFIVKEKKHKHFERRGDDLVYKYKLDETTRPRRSDDKVEDSGTSGDHKAVFELSFPLLNGETFHRTLPATSSLLRRGQSLTIPNLGMPIRKSKGRECGNLIIEFE